MPGLESLYSSRLLSQACISWGGSEGGWDRGRENGINEDDVQIWKSFQCLQLEKSLWWRRKVKLVGSYSDFIYSLPYSLFESAGCSKSGCKMFCIQQLASAVVWEAYAIWTFSPRATKEEPHYQPAVPSWPWEPCYVRLMKIIRFEHRLSWAIEDVTSDKHVTKSRWCHRIMSLGDGEWCSISKCKSWK